jgi:predicted secreted protein
MTTGIINGTDLNIYLTVGGTDKPIARATSCELSVSMNLRDATTKDSGGDAERLPGLAEWSVSVDALYSEDYAATKQGMTELFTALKTGAKVAVVFSTQQTGDKSYKGDAYVSDLSLNAGTEENATYSASFQGTGEIEVITISAPED